MKKQPMKLKCLLVLFAAVPAVDRMFAQEEEGKWKVGIGVDYSTGDYGDDSDTDILFVPTDISYTRGAWGGKLTVPWLSIDGPGSVVGGGDGAVVVGDGAGIDASGLGDIWGAVTYSVPCVPPELFFLDLVGKVKFPTADEDKGLGTGEFDYTLQADLFKSLGRFTPMATVAYKIKGDPSGTDLNNVFYVSLGGDYRCNETINFGATLDYQEATSDSSDDALEIFSYLGYRVTDSALLTVYGYVGLMDGSPDVGGGLQYRITF